MVQVVSREVWLRFLEQPIARLEAHGLESRVLQLLEQQRSFVYVRDLQNLTDADCLEIANFGRSSLKQLRLSLQSLMGALERGRV